MYEHRVVSPLPPGYHQSIGIRDQLKWYTYQLQPKYYQPRPIWGYSPTIYTQGCHGSALLQVRHHGKPYPVSQRRHQRPTWRLRTPSASTHFTQGSSSVIPMSYITSIRKIPWQMMPISSYCWLIIPFYLTFRPTTHSRRVHNDSTSTATYPFICDIHDAQEAVWAGNTQY